ncbi:unnamed protein product [Polarella glacialis]|uniref:TLC domain-containing protein n=1 Tax=Polarella glacialis TaxID=89957 RepID=A0A813I260_POLGL|nr:unnamed protein product [Polarella glacialis]
MGVDWQQGIMLISTWCVIWGIGHHLFWPIWNARVALICSPIPIDRYRNRLCRSQVYCVLAVAGGFLLLFRYRWCPNDLLYLNSWDHQELFAMAAAHWVVAAWEDAQSCAFLGAGLTSEDNNNNNNNNNKNNNHNKKNKKNNNNHNCNNKDTRGQSDPSKLLSRAYLVHHLMAGLGFAAVLFSQSCTAIGVFGLLYELPVLLMNHREFLVYADQPPEWFRDSRRVQSFWKKLRVLFVIGRGGPSLVYLHSLCFWSDDLRELSLGESFVYHSMAISFTALNFVLWQTFLAAWARKDLDNALRTEEGQFAGAFTH